MRKSALTLIAAAVLFGAAGPASAQVNGSASITVPSLMTLGVTNTTVTFADPDFAAFDAGYVTATSAASAVTTRANVLHNVQVTAGAANMTYTGSESPAPTKASSDLEWSTDGSTWTPLSTTAADVFGSSLSRGDAARGDVQYRMALDVANDLPGDYGLAFTYTIIAN
jgi:hypothetical protein